MNLKEDITELLQYISTEFGLGQVVSFKEITSVKVNKTYKVEVEINSRKQSYIFQNVNTYVFKKPKDVMENIRRVTEHIERYNPSAICLHYRTTTSGLSYFDMHTSFWRVYRYIDSVTYNTSRDPVIVRNAGLAFGNFQRSLGNFDPTLLHTTIANFHNTTARLATLESSLLADPLDRAATCTPETRYILSMKPEALVIDHLAAEGKIPLRVTHNDTKINNVLFDRQTGNAICVIDLDTVMPGYAGHDFGDAIRSVANSMGSASLEFDKVHIDLDIFKAFSQGFLAATGSVLTRPEIDSLAQSSLVITLELASRYLNDYLTGDYYFHAAYPTQNLDRARNLIALAKDMHKSMPQMQSIIQSLSN